MIKTETKDSINFNFNIARKSYYILIQNAKNFDEIYLKFL